MKNGQCIARLRFVEQIMSTNAEDGWYVISMKADSKRIFAFE